MQINHFRMFRKIFKRLRGSINGLPECLQFGSNFDGCRIGRRGIPTIEGLQISMLIGTLKGLEKRTAFERGQQGASKTLSLIGACQSLCTLEVESQVLKRQWVQYDNINLGMGMHLDCGHYDWIRTINL